MKKKLFLFIGIIVGMAVMAVPIFYLKEGQMHTKKLLAGFEKELNHLEEEQREEKKESGNSEQTTSYKKKETVPENKEVIGIIEIEELGIRYPIVEGTSAEKIRYAIGHITGTAGIGEEGNCVLAGHNGSRYGRFFTDLDEIDRGDKVELTDKKGNVHGYEVIRTLVVDPYDTKVREQTGEEILTLLTCSDMGTKRFICKCIPVEERKQEK